MKELIERNCGLDQRFQRIDATRFTAAVYRNGSKVYKGYASIASGTLGRTSTAYAMNDEAQHGEMNEAVYARAYDQTLYLKLYGCSRMEVVTKRSSQLNGQQNCSGSYLSNRYNK